MIKSRFFFIFISYCKSAARISKSIKQLPRAPAQEAADWVEYMQSQGGLQYLRPRGLDMPFYQLYLLDMLLLATLVVMTSFFVVMFLAKFIKIQCSRRKKKGKLGIFSYFGIFPLFIDDLTFCYVDSVLMKQKEVIEKKVSSWCYLHVRIKLKVMCNDLRGIAGL